MKRKARRRAPGTNALHTPGRAPAALTVEDLEAAFAGMLWVSRIAYGPPAQRWPGFIIVGVAPDDSGSDELQALFRLRAVRSAADWASDIEGHASYRWPLTTKGTTLPFLIVQMTLDKPGPIELRLVLELDNAHTRAGLAQIAAPGGVVGVTTEAAFAALFPSPGDAHPQVVDIDVSQGHVLDTVAVVPMAPSPRLVSTLAAYD